MRRLSKPKAPKLTKEEKEELKKNHKCINCAHAYLMRNGNNPIIAMCKCHNDTRQVANLHICEFDTFIERKTEMKLNTFIFCNR